MPKTLNDREKAQKYRAQILDALNKFGDKHTTGDDLLRRYKNEMEPSDFSVGGQRIAIPAGISVIDSLFAALTAVNVEANVINLAHGTRDQAKLAQTGIREVWREQKGGRKSAYSIKNSLVPAMGWLKVGYDYATKEVEQPRSDDDIATDIQELYQGAQEAGLPPPTPDETAELIPRTSKVQEVERDRIVLDFIPWKDMLFDPYAKREEDIRWHCQITRLPVEEVKENPAYREYVKEHSRLKDLDELEADITAQFDEDDDYFGFNEDIRRNLQEYCTIYEFWNHVTGTFCVLPKSGDFLLYEDANPFATHDDLEDKSPFVLLTMRDATDEVWGLSDMKVILPLLDELNFYRTMLANYLERMVPKVAGPSDALDEAGQTAFESKEPGAFVPVNPSYDGNALKSLDPPQLPSEVYNMIERIFEDMREATGLNEVLRGLFTQGRKTATETEAVVESGTARQSEKRNKLEEFYLNIFRRILFLMQMFYDGDRVSRLTQTDADEVWVWNKDDITFEADLEISLSPKEVATPQSRFERAMAVTNYVAPLQQFVNIEAVLKYGLEEMGVPEDVIQLILKTAQEQQEGKQEAAQEAAAQAQAAEGVVDPSMIPGPESAGELTEAVNPGEIPDQLGPDPEDIAELTGGPTGAPPNLPV